MTLANIYPLYKVLYGFVPVQNRVYTRDGRFCCPNRSYDSRFFQRTLRFGMHIYHNINVSLDAFHCSRHRSISA
ncbi:hypothetical protein PC118_g22895 [Phytophthora cactorum]|uniref:Uncharacterized protein n=1 Tax=Phytophthora cactorum TaxID=29920 RepID=A0A8T0YA88_9STRA|nr:hypothetical protein PC112_g22966 [Phytophthora cactorum]KAG2818593.1 hypothetical protein PC113_g22841 [Phytophthora cactorum]KAG2879726.1 hypothetical protein PC115_g22725 [Phytophthora cactorum]KAG2959692.1 hypothetical protein PC118_g22895 [Phytophthora cactorum]KAG2964663.1 hypothetical protein PC119_g25195 [Phytophthora cactorum]